MSIRNVKTSDLELLVRWGSPHYAAEAEQELKRRRAARDGDLAAVAGDERQVLVNPPEATAAFPKGRWS